MSAAFPWAALVSHWPGLEWGRLESYAEELERWNRAIRLVGPRERAGIRGQIADALLPFLLCPPEFPLLDIGSGAGLPGIPLAIAYPGQQVVCLEANLKKVSFLRHAVRYLGLPAVHVAAGRAEDLLTGDPVLAGGFQTVTARAVTDVQALLSLCRPFLATTGRVFLPRGAESAPRVKGWELILSKAYDGPLQGAERQLFVYRPKDPLIQSDSL